MMRGRTMCTGGRMIRAGTMQRDPARAANAGGLARAVTLTLRLALGLTLAFALALVLACTPALAAPVGALPATPVGNTPEVALSARLDGPTAAEVRRAVREARAAGLPADPIIS